MPEVFPIVVMPAAILAPAFGGPGATLSYASGPFTGQRITNPSTLNGNGLATVTMLWNNGLKSLDNATNDLRVSRVWQVGGGNLTATAGFYKSQQTIDGHMLWAISLTDVAGDGQSHLLDLTTAANVARTQNGIIGYGADAFAPGWHRRYDLEYGVNAPYGSLNFKIGEVAIGGSVRYDFGKVRGNIYSNALGGGRVGVTSYDVNGDGVISAPERVVSVLPLLQPGLVHYDYNYLSYSTGINWRIAEPFAVFGRYSKGGRANGERILFGPEFNWTTGKPRDNSIVAEQVKQAEVGLKYRQRNMSLNVTGFWATATEHNQFNMPRIDRAYRAFGVELEGSYRYGPFSLRAGATVTSAKITQDAFDPTTIGKRPRHQPTFIFQATPQYEAGPVTLGANFVGSTSSYSQDTNQLKMPGFVITGLFAQVRPVSRVTLGVNVNNLFDVMAVNEVDVATVPAMGTALARVNDGRTITGSLRFDF